MRSHYRNPCGCAAETGPKSISCFHLAFVPAVCLCLEVVVFFDKMVSHFCIAMTNNIVLYLFWFLFTSVHRKDLANSQELILQSLIDEAFFFFLIIFIFMVGCDPCLFLITKYFHVHSAGFIIFHSD